MFLFNLFKKEEKNKQAKKRIQSSADKSAMQFDMLYQLSYMSVIASAGVPRSQIFSFAARVPCASAEYFRKIEVACRQLQYDYARACQVVGDSVKDEDIKGLLLRFSSSLLSGEPEKDFLVREAEALGEAYSNSYSGKLETLKLWTDAYVSLIMSAVLVVIVGIVSTMIWKMQTSFILGLVTVSVVVTTVGLWLIYLMTPREYKVLRKPGSREQKMVQAMFRLLAPVAIAFAALCLVANRGLGPALIVLGIFSLPVGYISRIDDTKVDRRDSELGAFLRSLGGVATATGSTVRESVSKIDFRAIHYLYKDVVRLHKRFAYGIKAKLCWDRFIEETGSEVANRSVGMFYDAIDIGGEPEQAGYHASLFANKISLLRARRKNVSSPFTWLCIAMHAAVVCLLVFISEIITIFSNLVKAASQNLPEMKGAAISSFTSFNFSGLELLHALVVPLVLIYTISNAAAPAIADGGSKYKILFNLGLTSLISGAALTGLPVLARMLFSGIKV